VVRPVKELKAFGRLTLAAGQSQVVEFIVPTDMLGFTGGDGKRVVEPGAFELQVGASSGDIRLVGRVEVCGEKRQLGEDWRMFSRFVADAK
jgi:beta-glucosidase